MRGTELHTQLSAMAASVDRANRPSSLLALPLVLVIAALIVTMWSVAQLRSARGSVIAERNNRRDIEKLVQEIRAESESAIDFEKLYPRQTYFGTEIIASWEKQGVAFSTPPVIGEPISAIALSFGGSTIVRQDLQCSVASEPLELILEWVDNVLRNQTLRGQVWVSSLQLSQSGAGWQASIRFSLYEYRK